MDLLQHNPIAINGIAERELGRKLTEDYVCAGRLLTGSSPAAYRRIDTWSMAVTGDNR
jgi:hypothetical protein